MPIYYHYNELTLLYTRVCVCEGGGQVLQVASLRVLLDFDFFPTGKKYFSNWERIFFQLEKKHLENGTINS